MADDDKYEAALAAALAILHRLTLRPDMTHPERLSCVTFAILDAMHRVADQPAGDAGIRPRMH